MNELIADLTMGSRAVRWEAARLWTTTGIELDPQSLAWVGGGLVALLFGLLLVLSVRRARARNAALARPRPASSRPARQSRRSRSRRHRWTPADPRLDRARTLARKGGLSLEVARTTHLSRDAVELLARVQQPDGIAGPGRSFRRTYRRAAAV